MKKSTSLLLFLFICFSLNAQNLQRKGSLGVLIGNVENGDGILIQKVFEGATGANLGMQADDILLEVDNKPYKNTQELVAETSTWRVGKKVKVKVMRDGKKIELSGGVIGKPMEKSDFGKVIYGAVSFDGGMLRSILELPNGVENPPVMFFLPGFGCGSLDFYFDASDPIKQFTESLVKQGIAVYRVEKPGMGDSQGGTPCNEMGYDYEIDAFRAALKVLKKDSRVDTDKIFLYGHSLGGITAPVLASENPVKGVICWGSISTTWYEYVLRILRDRPNQRKTDYVETELDFRRKAAFLTDYLMNQMPMEELMKNPDYQALEKEGYLNWDGEKIMGMHYTFMQQINKVNIPEAWKKANTNVLALHGEFDFHAIDSEWAKRTADIVNYYSPGKGEWKVIPKTEHGFATVESMEENIRLLDSGQRNIQFLIKNYNPKVAEVVGNWIHQKLGA